MHDKKDKYFIYISTRSGEGEEFNEITSSCAAGNGGRQPEKKNEPSRRLNELHEMVCKFKQESSVKKNDLRITEMPDK
jgi:hypothetical protein